MSDRKSLNTNFMNPQIKFPGNIGLKMNRLIPCKYMYIAIFIVIRALMIYMK